MINKKHILLATALCVTTPMALQAEHVEGEFDQGYFVFKSEDGNFEWKFDGRIYLDAVYIDSDENRISTNTDFRRARLAIKTRFYKDWAGEFDIDFKNNKTKVKDMWVSYDPFENATIKVGNQKPFFSMAEVTTSRWYPLMETSTISDWSATGRRVGASFSYWQPDYFVGVTVMGEETSMNDEKEDLVDAEVLDELIGWAEDCDGTAGDCDPFDVGAIEDEIEPYSLASERFGYAARAVYRPLLNDDITHVIHLGASVVNHKPMAADLGVFKVKGEFHDVGYIGDKFKPWKDETVDEINASSLEFAARWDKFYLQSEYIVNDISFVESNMADYEVSGYYVEASYFINGEGRPYNLTDGEFGPVVPTNGSELEFIVRYDTFDSNDLTAGEDGEGIENGELTNLTFGLNWYVNTNVIIRLNYSIVETDAEADIEDADDKVLAARLEFLF